MTPRSDEGRVEARQRPCARCIIGGVIGSLVVAWSLILTVKLVRTLTRGGGSG